MQRWLAELDPVDLALRLSLLTLLWNPGIRWSDRVPVLVLSGGALLLPALSRSRVIWGGLFGLMALQLFRYWPHSDNHTYLTAYWCLAVACSLSASDSRRVLATNARLLIGFSFGFAVLWKLVLSPDFADGTFFRTTLLFDSRFADFARLFAGLTPAIADANESFVAGEGGSFVEPARLVALAKLTTVWTALLESGIAILFLWPRPSGERGALAALRDAALLLFCTTTYAVAPVAGFGWLLLSMGLAQCPAERWRVRGLYLVAFFVVLFHQSVPWLELLAEAVGR